ncbi:hypothetical protein ABW20_dc0105038 [Dactylellina cionopaga]|nr:hypothetical protein ABW20_dc0105038 [Dactylellina cionopaga]
MAWGPILARADLGVPPAPTTTDLSNNNVVTVSQQQAAPSSTGPGIPAYSYTPDKALTGSCRLTNLTQTTGQGLFSNYFQCEQLVPAGSTKKSNAGATAAAVVFALLFAATLGLLLFVWWRGRRIGSGPANDSAYALKENDPTSSNPAAEISSLQHQLNLERRRVNDLQAALLSQSSSGPQSGGWSAAQPKDDREVKRSFAGVVSEIKDFAGNYYRSSSSSSSNRVSVSGITGETKEILDDCVSAWETMVGDQKGRMLLVRVLIGEYLRRCWIDGEFLGRKIGRATRVVDEGVVAGSTMQQSHLWRVQTLARLTDSIDNKGRKAAVAAITEKIITLLDPFSPQQSPSAAKKYLENTVARMSALYYSLATQNAYYEVTPYISLSSERTEEEEAKFELATCDDVEQKYDIGTDARGMEWSAAEGRSVKGFVFPAVVKYGDGRGGGWDGEVVIVFKAQVVL